MLRGANFNVSAGSYDRNNRQMLVESGGYLQSAAEIKRLVVGVDAGRPVYLGAVARVEDGPAEPSTYTRISFGPGYTGPTTPAARPQLSGRDHRRGQEEREPTPSRWPKGSNANCSKSAQR